MSASDLGPQLRKLYGDPTADPRSREALEQRLMARYDERVIPRPRQPLSMGWVVAGLMLVSGAAVGMSTPTQVVVEVGKRVVVHIGTEDRIDTVPTEISEVARLSGAKVVDLWVKAHRYRDWIEVEVDVWGDRLPSDGELQRLIEERMDRRITAIKVESLEGQVRSSLVRHLAQELFKRGTTPEQREKAREALIEELRKRHGTRPQVEVEVTEDEDGRHMLKMKVRPEDGSE